MRRGLINHLDLTVSNLEASVPFYDLILGSLGYVRSSEYAGDVPNWTRQVGTISLSIGLHKAKTAAKHDRYAPGLHHLAFHVASRREVHEVHDLVVSSGGTVLDAPAEYDYTLGYYAVFFADPDGLKLEVVYEPRFEHSDA